MKIQDVGKPQSILSLLGDGAVLPSHHEMQTDAYKSGRALVGHIKDAHKGIEQPDCRACKELRAKYEG